MTELIPSVNRNDHIIGDARAPIEFVEYGDYACPYCARAFMVVKHIQQKMGSELKFCFRNFPLRNLHPHAFSAAVATEAAGVQGKFWEMHELVFENQRNLSPANLLRLASVANLDTDRFRRDIQRSDLTRKVEVDIDSGIRSGVHATPAFFVNGKKFNGDWSTGQLIRFLECELAWTSIVHS